MTIVDSIKHSQSLIQQLSQNIQNDADVELLTLLSAELKNIAQLVEKTSPTLQENKPEIKSGCYIFADEKGFFCPTCYDKGNTKIATKRMNSQLRVCPLCRASIKYS